MSILPAPRLFARRTVILECTIGPSRGATGTQADTNDEGNPKVCTHTRERSSSSKQSIKKRDRSVRSRKHNTSAGLGKSETRPYQEGIPSLTFPIEAKPAFTPTGP